MPLSTSSAVRTPGSDSPSSTSVMATAGRIPTTTVRASSTRAIAAMFASMRPMNESTISSAEMSISTPRACVSAIRAVRSSWSVIARRSCMSTWMLTSRQSPILRIGMRSIPRSPLGGSRSSRQSRPVEGDREGVRERRLGDDIPEVDAEVHDSLCDLGPYAADDALRPHEARRRHGLQQVLGDQRVDGGHPGDVDDRDARAGLDDLLEQALHDDLRPRAVERTDQRKPEDAVPQLDDGSRQLEHLLLLAADPLLATLLVHLGGVEPELVEQHAALPDGVGERRGVALEIGAEALEQRLLEREDEGRRLGGREPLPGALLREASQELARLVPGRRGDVLLRAAVLEHRAKCSEKPARLLLQLVVSQQVAAQRRRLDLMVNPLGQDLVAVPPDD